MPTRIEQIYGSLLGHLFADALGSTFEGLPSEQLHKRFENRDAAFSYAVARDGLRYTDDGQMMLALAEYLVDNETIDPNGLMREFVRVYESWRGYGRGARVLIEAFRDQADYAFMAEHLFPGGSLGNGGAMRSSPVGLVFMGDIERIRTEAKQSAWPTHRHELGIEGAQLIALAASFAQTETEITPESLSELLLPHCDTVVFQNRIKRLAEVQTDDDISQFGNGIEAHESVVTALACFSLFPTDYRAAVSNAFWQGGDTDTIGAMTGALVGARVGPDAVADLPLIKLEDGKAFGDYVQGLACRMSTCP
jgi:poly(ADP-ribose) glycohydrolase ARH3